MARPTQVEIHDALTELGATEEEVVASLKAQGIKGFTHEGECVIQAYLQKRFGCKIMVGYIYAQPYRYMVAEKLIKMPDPVRRAVRAFDLGELPELVDPSEHREFHDENV